MEKNKTEIFLLGLRGAGKTSFLTGLSLLSRAGRDSHFQTVPGNSPSARMLRDLRELADMGKWPPPTSTVNLLEFELTFKKQFFSIFFLDSPGEDLLEVMETYEFDTHEKIREHAVDSQYVLVFADPTQDLITPINNTSEQTTRRRQDALAQGIGYLNRERGASGKPLPDIAVILSKADLLQESGDLDINDLRRKNDGFFKQLQKYSRRSEKMPVFLITVCGYEQEGSSESFPSHPHPTGYDVLFDWMSSRDFRQRHGRSVRRTLVAGLVASCIIVGYLYWDYNLTTTIESSIEHASLENVHAIVAQRDVLRESWLRALDARVAREMDAVEAQINLVTTDEAYRRLDDTLALLTSMHHFAQSHRLRDLRVRIEYLRESSLFASITAAVRAGEQQQALRLITEYRQRFPTGRNIQGVESLELSIAGVMRSSLRGRVQSVPVTDRSSLAVKIGEIRRYLAVYPDDTDAEQIQTALRLAEQFTAVDAVRLLMIGCGFDRVAGERRHEIRWAAGRPEELKTLFRQNAKVSMSTFTEYMEIDHTRWSAIKIELWSTPLAWFDKLMATGEFNILRDAHFFDGERRIPLRTDTNNWRDLSSWVRMHVQLRGTAGWQSVSKNDLEAYARFISPGRVW